MIEITLQDLDDCTRITVRIENQTMEYRDVDVSSIVAVQNEFLKKYAYMHKLPNGYDRNFVSIRYI